MADYQVLGNYIISEKMKETPVASVYRGIIAPDGKFEKFVIINELKQDLAGFADFFKGVNAQFKTASKLSGTSVATPIDIMEHEGTHYSIYQFDDGRFLDDVIRRSTDEGFPFSIDHVLLIASKTLAALSYCYSKGSPYGFLVPSGIHLSFEGDVKLYETASAPHMPALVAANPGLQEVYSEYVHPDVLQKKKSAEVYDVFSIGAVIYRLLTGKPFIENGRVPDVEEKIAGAVLGSSSFGDEPIPADIKEILVKALNIGSGYQTVAEFNEVLENLIFSGDYSPTTFNLAFFMHSLYREESEQSAKLLDLEKTANYAGYFLKAGEGGEAKKLPKGVIIALIALVVIVAAAGGYFFVQKQKADKERALAQQQAQEQLEKQKQLEEQKQKEIEAMKAQMQEQLNKMMQEAEKEADKRAREEIMRRAKEEQERQLEEIRKAEQQKKKIEEERRKQEELIKQKQAAEEQKRKEEEERKKKEAEEQKRKEEEARQKKLEEARQAEQQKKALFGQLVGLSEVDVEPKLIYQEKPKINTAWRVKGTFTLTALVDENGNTVDVKVIKGLPTVTRGSRLAERSVVDAVNKWKYTPALKDGVAVKVWITVRITI